MITVNAGFARIPAKAGTAKLSATDWAVLHVIALHADKDGRAFPGMGRIAGIIGIKRYNVPRSIARLEQRGLLRRQRVPRPKGGWQVNHYELVYEPIGDVVTTDNTSPEGVLNTDNRCSQQEQQGVVCIDALTNHLTTQGTEQAYQEEAQAGVGVLNGGGVRSVADTPPGRCRWPLGAGCERPAVPGMGMCARHEATA